MALLHRDLCAIAFIAAILPGLSHAGTNHSPSADTLASDSAAFTTAPDIQRLPARGYEDLIALRPGTVRLAYGAPIHLRGGRPEELAYYIDGFSQQDPFTGLSFTAINRNTIRALSLMPVPISPEYGLVTSGIGNLTTISGSDRLHGALEAVTDNFHGERADYDLYGLAVDGPLIPNTDRLTFSAASERRTFGNRDPGGPGAWDWLWNWQGKARWEQSENLQLGLGTLGSYNDWKGVPRAYYFDAAHAPRTIDENYSAWGTITHALNPQTSYSASVNWLSSRHRTGDGVYLDNLWGYSRPNGNPFADTEQLLYSWDDINLDPDSLTHDRKVPLHTDIVDSVWTVALPDGDTEQHAFVIRGDESRVYNNYYQQEGSYIGGRFNVRSQVRPCHELLAGGEFQRHTVRFYDNLWPTYIYRGQPTGFQDINSYGYDVLAGKNDEGLDDAKHPLNLAGYVQDVFTLDRLTISGGVRLDYLDYRTQRLIDAKNPLDPFHRDATRAGDTTLPKEVRDSLNLETNRLTASDLTNSASMSRLSPRLGFSVEVADGSLLHASFGRYIQRPPFQDLFLGYRFLEYKILTGGYDYPFGNPALRPEAVSSTEIGWRQRLTSSADASIKAFYKDHSDLIEPERIAATPNSYWTYTNSGSAVAKGVELEIELHPTRGLTAQANYTLQQARETGTPMFDDNIAWTNASPVKVTAPRDFDRRHTFNGIVSVSSGPRDRARPLSYLWERTQATCVFSAASGFPYTPTKIFSEVTLFSMGPPESGKVNSQRAPAVYRLDLKADKEIPLAGGFSLDVYLWIINLFDRDNAVYVYHSTGSPDETGWLTTPDGRVFEQRWPGPHDSSLLNAEQKYRLREADPANLDIPRQIRVGMRLLF